jgi:hypothetical protein
MAFPKRLTKKTHRGRVELPHPEPDVFELVPPTPDTVYLERLLRLGPEPSPFARLLVWEPEDEDDKDLQTVLLHLLREQMKFTPLRCRCCGRIHPHAPTGGAK